MIYDAAQAWSEGRRKGPTVVPIAASIQREQGQICS